MVASCPRKKLRLHLYIYFLYLIYDIYVFVIMNFKSNCIGLNFQQLFIILARSWTWCAYRSQTAAVLSSFVFWFALINQVERKSLKNNKQNWHPFIISNGTKRLWIFSNEKQIRNKSNKIHTSNKKGIRFLQKYATYHILLNNLIWE